MQGDITVNGKKMTVTEIVEAYCELKDQNNQLEIKLKETEQEVQDYKTVVNNIKENYKNLMTRCMSGADLALSEHRFGCLTICLNSEYDKLLNEIDDLERELRVKEELFKIKSGLKSEKLPDSITIDGYKCKIIQTEQGLYISRDDIYRIIEDEKRDLRERIEKQENRYQSDCITINKLNVTIDTLVDKLAMLRKQVGL